MLVSLLRLITSVWLSSSQLDLDHNKSQLTYRIVIDAGSSGTRAYLYEVSSFDQSVSISKDANGENIQYKDQGGLGLHEVDFQLLDSILREVLSETIGKAKIVDSRMVRKIGSIRLLATGGLRSLPEDEQVTRINDIEAIISDFAEQNKCLSTIKISAEILSGQKEGYFAWLSADYLRNKNSGLILI